MSIIIQNISERDAVGDHSYELRINEQPIVRFTHNREQGLAMCLWRAADAVMKRTHNTDLNVHLKALEP